MGECLFVCFVSNVLLHDTIASDWTFSQVKLLRSLSTQNASKPSLPVCTRICIIVRKCFVVPHSSCLIASLQFSFIYFIFGCAGSSLLCGLFSSWRARLSLVVVHTGLVLQHVGPSCIRTEPVSPALAGRFFAAEPSEQPLTSSCVIFCNIHNGNNDTCLEQRPRFQGKGCVRCMSSSVLSLT